MQQLPSSTVKLIGSSQVITSVFSVVKELVENSLDAGATNIEVKLEDFGFSKIEVRDNGTGIPVESTAHMALAHYTSKINSHSDLESLETYGFRGEALGSLCAVANVAMTTKTDADLIGYTYKLNHDGSVVSKTPSHQGTGTTVIASNLFDNLPVRKQFYSSTRKRRDELKKVERLIKAYSMIQHNVRFALRKDRETVLSGVVHQTLSSVLQSVLGSATMALMQRCQASNSAASVDAFLPRPGADTTLTSLTNADACYIYVNKRPVNDRHIEKLLKKYYQGFNNCEKNRCPVAFVSLSTSPDMLDVNLEPNKTHVYLRDKDSVYDMVEKLLSKVFAKPETELVPLVSKKAETASDPTVLNTSRPEMIDTSGLANDTQPPEDDAKHLNLSRDQINGVMFLAECRLRNERMSHSDDVIMNNNYPLSEECKTNIYVKDDITMADCIVKNSTDNPMSRCITANPIIQSNSAYSDDLADQSSITSQISSTLIDQSVTEMFDTSHSDDVSPSSSSSNPGLNPDVVTNIGTVVNFEKERRKLYSVFEPRKKISSQEKIANVESVILVPDLVNETETLESDKSDEESAVRYHKDARPIPPPLSARDSHQMSFSFTDCGDDGKLSLVLHKSCEEDTSRQMKHEQANKTIRSPASVQNQKLMEKNQTKLTDIATKRMFRTALQIYCEEMGGENDVIKARWKCLEEEEKEKYEKMEMEERELYWYQVISERKVQQKPKKRKVENPLQPLDQVLSRRIRVEKQYDHLALRRKICEIKRKKTENRNDGELGVIGRIPSVNLWLCIRGTELMVCNHERVQELLVYKEMLQHLKLDMHTLSEALPLNDCLESSHLDTLSYLKKSDVRKDGQTYVTDIRLVHNGLGVRLCQPIGVDECRYELYGLNREIALYSTEDLAETLSRIRTRLGDSDLLHSRPLKVVKYIKTLAMRQSGSDMNMAQAVQMEEMNALLKQYGELCVHETVSILEKTCLHGKPCVKTVYNMEHLIFSQQID